MYVRLDCLQVERRALRVVKLRDDVDDLRPARRALNCALHLFDAHPFVVAPDRDESRLVASEYLQRGEVAGSEGDDQHITGEGGWRRWDENRHHFFAGDFAERLDTTAGHQADRPDSLCVRLNGDDVA